MNFIYVMFAIYLPVLIFAIKRIADLIFVASYLLKTINMFLNELDGLASTFKNLKIKHIVRIHKKKLPRNSGRNRR